MLKASRPSIKTVTISTGDVYIMGLNGARRHDIVARNYKQPDCPFSDAELAAMGLCEADGTKVFLNEAAGVLELQKMHAADLRAIAVELLKHTDIATNKEEAEAVEKNS